MPGTRANVSNAFSTTGCFKHLSTKYDLLRLGLFQLEAIKRSNFRNEDGITNSKVVENCFDLFEARSAWLTASACKTKLTTTSALWNCFPGQKQIENKHLYTFV